MIKKSNNIFKHRFLLGAMLLCLMLQTQQSFSQLIVKDSIVATRCYDTKDALIALKISGGIQPYSYSWSNGGDKDVISGLVAGSYIVTITDSSVPNLSLIKIFIIKPKPKLIINRTDYACDVMNDIDATFIGSPSFLIGPLTFPIYESLSEIKDTSHFANLSIPSLTKYLPTKIGNEYYKYKTQKYFRSRIMDNYDPNLFLRLYVKDSNNCVLDTILPAFEKYDYLTLDLMPDTVKCSLKDKDSKFIEFKSNLPRSSLNYLYWCWQEQGINKYCYACDKIPIILGVNEYTIYAGRSCYAFYKDIYVDCYNFDNFQYTFLPNAFSPNGDGVNDLFFLNSVSGIVDRIERFAVYDRWGALVYELKDIDPNDSTQGWDGLVRNVDATSDVYACYAVLRLYDGSTKVVKGNVMLMR
jgi:gliding motility-associated-like protein